MKKTLTKEKKILNRDKKEDAKKRLKSPKGGLANQENIDALRLRTNQRKNYSLGKDKKKEETRYKNWISKTDMKRSFWIWRGKYSLSPKESEISSILKSHNIRFYREVSFDVIKRFDFYIPLLDLVIEYDGSQHFRSLCQIDNDIKKEAILNKLGIKYIRYNKTHLLIDQIKHDLINHPVIVNRNGK